MKVASVTEIGTHFGDYLKASAKGPVVVTRNGKPVAVLVRTGSKEDLERLLMGHSRALQAILEAARRRFRAGGGIPHETFWKEVEAETPAGTKRRSTIRRNGRAR